MKLTTVYTIELTQDETFALKTFLGSTSPADRVSSMQNTSRLEKEELERLSSIISDIYRLIDMPKDMI